MATYIPARREFLQNLKPVDVATLRDGTCHICFGNLTNDAKDNKSERGVLLHGTHHYGRECIRYWLQDKSTCPICRKVVHGGQASDFILDADDMIARQPSASAPIIDQDVLSLLMEIDKARNDDKVLAQIRERLNNSYNQLLQKRQEWFILDQALTMQTIAPYESIDLPLLPGQDTLRIHVAYGEIHIEILRDIVASIGIAFWNAGTARGGPVHVAVHPIAIRAMHGIFHELGRLDGQRLRTMQLVDDLFSVFNLGSSVRSEMDRLATTATGNVIMRYCRDFIVRILRSLIYAEERRQLRHSLRLLGLPPIEG